MTQGFDGFRAIFPNSPVSSRLPNFGMFWPSVKVLKPVPRTLPIESVIPLQTPYMNHSLNSLKGGYIGDYVRDYYRGY